MKKLIICTMMLCCIVRALEFSHRIRALGTGFASLIPDYETDLYRNPQLLEQNLVGAAYEPPSTYYYRPYWQYPIYVNYAPLNIAFLTNRFAVTGQYWFDYSYNLEPLQFGWESSAYQAYRIQDLWLLGLKNYVINIYNDLDHSRVEYLTSTNSQAEDRRLEYIIKSQVSLKLRNRLSLDLKLGLGIFQDTRQTDEYENYSKKMTLGLARLGLYCRNVSSVNEFTSWYFDIGSPLSNEEIDVLPYSVYAHVPNHESEFALSANTVISRFGAAKAVPIGERGFVAIGFTDRLLVQKTEDQDALEDLNLHGIVNTMSLPAAVEYPIKTVSLRFGAQISYTFQNLRETGDTAVAVQDLQHTLAYGYSFGIGWQPHRKIAVDIYNNSSLHILKNWALYVKYTF